MPGQEVPGKPNVSAGKFRVMCEGHADLDGQPTDGWKPKEMSDVGDTQKKGIQVLCDWLMRAKCDELHISSDQN